MSDSYKAELKFPNGTVKSSVTGTIQECSNWADNVIRSTGECIINIKRIDSNNCHSRCRLGKLCRYAVGSDDTIPEECGTYYKLLDLLSDAEDIRKEQEKSMKEYEGDDEP